MEPVFTFCSFGTWRFFFRVRPHVFSKKKKGKKKEMRKFWIFSLLATFLASVHGACADCKDRDNHFVQEVYSPIKVLNLSTCNGNTQGGWVFYDCETETVWVAPDSNTVVLDAEQYMIRAIMPQIGHAKDITFTDAVALVADSSQQQIRIYDKFNLGLIQIINLPSAPRATYWDQASKNLWVAVTNSLLCFGANPRWNPQPFNPVAIATVTLNSGPMGKGILTLGNLYQPVANTISVLNLHAKTIVNTIYLPYAPIPQNISDICLDVETGNMLITTDSNMAFLISTFDDSVQAQIPLGGSSGECAVLGDIRRAYIANQEGFVDVIDMDSQYLLQNFSTSPFQSDLSLTAINYESSTEIWTYNQQNLVVVYEWNRH